MESVLESARAKDYDTLTRDLTLYRWDEITEFYRQASVVDTTRGPTRPTEAQLYTAMRIDVRMFVRSYADLLMGRAATYSTKRLQIEGVDCYSVILWVEKGEGYGGILIHAVWKRPNGFKVLEWVDTAQATVAGIELWEKRARLYAPDPEARVFPDRMEFEQTYKQ